MSLYFVDTHYYCCYFIVYVIYVYKIIYTYTNSSIFVAVSGGAPYDNDIPDRDDIHILVSYYFPHK